MNESIELYFQPFIDIDYRIIGAESLVRWQHPEKGMIMPGVFIHLAEKTGLIVPLGYKVLEKACKYLRDWQEKNLVPEDFFLSVNFSPKQFKQQDLVEKIDEIMNHYNIKSKYLRIEITEFAYFENPDIAAHTIEQLSHRGIKIMIDDCGAPGNAIYNLRSLPEELINKGAITTLKLDKTLIDAIERYKDRLLFKHNLEMAWRLNFDVIIEGIETNNQEQIIKEIEQELVHDKIKIKILRQGYLYSKPVPENMFIYLFKNQVPVPENNETLNELFT